MLPTELRHQLTAKEAVHETMRRAVWQSEIGADDRDGLILLSLREILLDLIAAECAQRVRDGATLSAPVEGAVGAEVWQRYMQSLANLDALECAAVVLFVECGAEFEEIAPAVGYSSPREARHAIAQILHRIHREGQSPSQEDEAPSLEGEMG